MKVVKVFLWMLVLIWAGVIFYMSNQTATQSSDLSGSVIWDMCERFYKGFLQMSSEEKADLVEYLQDIVRTVAHICEYGLLGILIRTAFIPYKLNHKILISSLISLSYSISDEIHQFFVPGRAYQFSDILCDTFGAVLGILAVSLICGICKKIRIKNSKKGLQFN